MKEFFEYEKVLRRVVMQTLDRLGAHVTNHEDSWSAGIPDLSYGYKGTDGWIELKAARCEDGKRVTLGFRPNQVFWMRRRAETGNGRVWGLVQVTSLVKGWITRIWIIHAKDIAEITGSWPITVLDARYTTYESIIDACEALVKKEGPKPPKPGRAPISSPVETRHTNAPK